VAENKEHRYQIRTANIGDILDIAMIQLDSQNEELSRDSGLFRIRSQRILRTSDYYQDQIGDTNSRLALVYDMTINKVVGIGLGRICNPEGPVAEKSGEIVDVWVEYDHKGKDLCAKLVAELLSFFKTNGISSLTVSYAKEDLEAESLWYRLSFKPILVTALGRIDDIEAAFLTKCSQTREEVY
jgi:hypothetical protein